MLNKLKLRWKVDSNIQLIIILIVFSVSGSATLFIKNYLFHWINYDPEWPFILKAIIYILTIIPIYQITLLLIGTLFGQFDFFWRFEKKALRRLGIKLDKPC